MFIIRIAVFLSFIFIPVVGLVASNPILRKLIVELPVIVGDILSTNGTLLFYEGHLVADVAMDYGLRFMEHANTNEIVVKIYDHVCGVLKHPGKECRDVPQPNTLINVFNVSKLWPAGGTDPWSLLYIRQGYTADEMAAYHCLYHNCPVLIYQQLIHFIQHELDHPPNATRLFESIYAFGIWGGNNEEKGYGSGTGSSAKSAMGMIDNLPRIIDSYSIDHVIDLGCGSMNWMAPLLLRISEDRSRTGLPHLRYTGVDASATAIGRAEEICNRFEQDTPEKFPSAGAEERGKFPREDWRFVHTDVSARDMDFFSLLTAPDTKKHSTPPRAVLVIARHIFFHLPVSSVENILSSLHRFHTDVAKRYPPHTPVYLLATNHLLSEEVTNDDSRLHRWGMGAYRPLNLYAPPFSLSSSLEEFDDFDGATEENNRKMALWKLPC